MNPLVTQLDALEPWYRQGLIDDVLPFWLTNSLDTEHGGYISCLDRQGKRYDTDKSIWVQGRFAWLLGTVYSEFDQNEAYARAAESGVNFLRKHAFDTDGKMFFTTTRDGKPLRRRRYYYSEAFAAQAYAAWARVSGDNQASADAQRMMEQYFAENCKDDIAPKNTGVRPAKAIGKAMIGLGVAQTLRDCIQPAGIEQVIDDCIAEIRDDFVKPELKVVMETVAPNGDILDHADGRLLNPGHAIEGAWFILREAIHRNNDPELTKLGVNMLNWMWDWGWDEEYGGIRYFCDLKGHPVSEYWHDMKFWWPQCETLVATLMAWQLTGDDIHLKRHLTLQKWTANLFPDPKHGEWYGYLHRDGRVSSDLKGNMWKSPFHIPRMQLACAQLLAKGKERTSASIEQPSKLVNA